MGFPTIENGQKDAMEKAYTEMMLRHLHGKCMMCGAELDSESKKKWGCVCGVCMRPPQEKHCDTIPLRNFQELVSEYVDGKDRPFSGKYLYGLDIMDGSAWLVDYRSVEGMYYGVKTDYEELKAVCKNIHSAPDVEGLCSDNWMEYTLLQEDESMSLVDPFDDSWARERYILSYHEDGYFVTWECGSMMAGRYEDMWLIPVGFFADKTPEEIARYFNMSKGMISGASISENQIERLIRTDKYRLAKKQSAGEAEEAR